MREMRATRHDLLSYRQLAVSCLLAACFAVAAACAHAASVPATYKQGSLHGFLLLKSRDGKVIATGDQTNIVHGDEVHSELLFRFRDGSIDDEVADYRQGDAFEL